MSETVVPLGPLHEALPWHPGVGLQLQACLALGLGGFGAYRMAMGQGPLVLLLGACVFGLVVYRMKLGQAGPPGIHAVRLRPEGLEIHDRHEGLVFVPYDRISGLERRSGRGPLELWVRLDDGRAHIVPGALTEQADFEWGLAAATGQEWRAV